MDGAQIQIEIQPGTVAARYEKERTRLVESGFIKRLWARDARVLGDDDQRAAVIANRLGWLDSPAWLSERVSELQAFSAEVRGVGFQHVVLLGMGGSSLCPEVLSRAYGLPEYLNTFNILDATDPDTVARIEGEIELERTLFVVASKSGSTVETRSQAAYFFARIAATTERPGSHFVAITDEGSSLQSWAEQREFRQIFINPSDIGGRYSALSYFGMVAAALLELPLGSLARLAVTMSESLQLETPDNPALQLGAVIGAAAWEGRDKLTFVTDMQMASVVPWIEQLVAESTGKEGRGVVPIEAEPPASPEEYGDDRILCYMHVTGVKMTHCPAPDSHDPSVQICVPSRDHLGALFLLWEVAVSAAGRVLDINPYDEPNVQESKDNTRKLLEDYSETGRLEEPGQPMAGEFYDITTAHFDAAEAAGSLSRLLDNAAPDEYVSLLYFGDRSDAIEESLTRIRAAIRAQSGLATLRGYGPRYLHSIGQLYKGGAQKGRFVVFTIDPVEARAIPGSPFDFGALLRAQALGDFSALAGRGRPVLRVHLKGDPAQALERFAATSMTAAPAHT